MSGALRSNGFARSSVAFFLILGMSNWTGCGSQPETVPAGLGDQENTDAGDGESPNEPTIAPASVDDGTTIPVIPEAPAEVNQAPVANAGANRTATSGQRVSLDGSASFDADGDALSFQWSLVSPGVRVTVLASDGAVARFTAPTVMARTALRFLLAVSDGEEQSTDEVVIEVLPLVVPASVGPTADAGADRSVEAGEMVTLDASASSAGSIGSLVFSWAQISGSSVSLSNPLTATPTFIAPTPIGAPSQLLFEVTVTEGGLSDSDEVAIVVQPLASAPPAGGGGGGTPPPPTDNCPADPAKTEPGVCGCGIADIDTDGDGTPNCIDACPNDSAKIAAGLCGCGVADTDTDGDATPDCLDGCPNDPTTANPAQCAPNVNGTAQSDWDLVMLRLVNRARSDPAGEAARLGSSVTDTRTAVPVLAYDRAIGQAATDHNTWMHLNFGGIASGRAPDSFSHYQTLDGLSTGTPASGTPGYTGATLGQRITAVGFNWGSIGENILTAYSTNAIAVNEAKIIANHKGWWESSGHRNNMLSANYGAFGHRIESRAFTPPRGGLNAPIDNLMFATQDYGRPLSNPRTYIFGLLYRDADGSGTWTPRDAGDANREGLAGVAIEVRTAGTTTAVATETTMDNGAFSVRVGDGTYDIVFTSSFIPGGSRTVSGVTISGVNTDAGDIRIP